METIQQLGRNNTNLVLCFNLKTYVILNKIENSISIAFSIILTKKIISEERKYNTSRSIVLDDGKRPP